MNLLTFPFHLTRELLRGIGMAVEILCPREDSRDEIVKNWPDGEAPDLNLTVDERDWAAFAIRSWLKSRPWLDYADICTIENAAHKLNPNK